MMTFDTFIIEFVNASLNVYLSYLFFCSIWKNKSKPYVFICCLLISDVLLTCSMLFLKGSMWSFFILFATTLLIAILFESKWTHKILYSGILLSLMSILEMITALIISAVFNTDFSAGKQGALYVSGMLISKLAVLLVILFIRFRKHKPLLQKFAKNYWGILIFPLASLIVILIQHSILIHNPDQNTVTLYLILFGYTLLLLANIVVFDFIDSLYQNAEADIKLKMANEIINTQTIRYQELIEHNKEVLKIQHDHKNFCIGILSELKSGYIDEAISRLTASCKIFEQKIPSRNDILYILVEAKAKEALSKKVDLDYEFRKLQELIIPAVDIAILIGAALDNAIEATDKCTDNRHIMLLVCVKNNSVVINIKNPVLNDINTGDLTTSKENKERHGFGILSMKQIASKFGGEVILSCSDKMFTTSIILNNSLNNINE